MAPGALGILIHVRRGELQRRFDGVCELIECCEATPYDLRPIAEEMEWLLSLSKARLEELEEFPRPSG
jgi:hypothetical protein